jgi:hypothetical protein
MQGAACSAVQCSAAALQKQHAATPGSQLCLTVPSFASPARSVGPVFQAEAKGSTWFVAIPN